MNCKRILALFMSVLVMVAFLPTQSVGHIHTHAAEIVCEHNYTKLNTVIGCEEPGYTNYYCNKCLKTFKEDFTDPVGHSVNSDGICENCGQNRNFAPGDLNADGLFLAEDLALVKGVLLDVVTDAAKIDAVDCNGDYNTDLVDLIRLKKHIANDVGSAPFTYDLDSNGNAVITGFDNSVSGAVTLPSSIDGYKVTAIGEGVFENADDVTSILIPNTVNTIEKGAFTGCGSLMGISLPNSINTIGDNAFTGCSSMPNIRLSENIVEIGEGAFSFCSSLQEINIPEKVTVLNNSAFNGCSSLTFVGLPENLKEIKTYTFYGCEKLESVSIPITVVEVGDCAFDSCESLLSVVIPYETAFGDNVFANCPKLVVKGYAGTGGIDAAINSGVGFEVLECGHSDFVLLYAENPTCTKSGYSGDKFCVSCGKIEQKGVQIAPSGHITELKSQRDATCDRDGYTGNTVCTVCDLVLSTGYTIKATGHYASNVEYIAVKPTCMTEGKYGTFTCEKCNKYINGNLILSLGHDYDLVGKKYSSCVEDGYTGDYKCSRQGCDYLIKGEVIPKGDHNYILYNFREPTCTRDGYSGDRICCGCGDVLELGKATTKDHTPITNNYKAATCTENGYSGDSKCAVCDAELTQGVVLPLLGHKSVLINYSEPTCTEDGYTGDQICSMCKVLVAVGNSIEKLGHKLVLINQKDCTPTEDGYTGDLVCETCGETVTPGKVIPANHTHTMEITNKKDATCTATGYTGDSTCSVCGYFVKGIVTPIKSHVITTTVVDPKCTEGGYTIDECNNCDYERKHANTDALGHNWDTEWTVGKQVSCTEDGEQYKNCSRCDEKQKETIKSEGHKLGEPQNTVEPTCTSVGYTGDKICSACGETIKGEEIPAKGHSFGDWQTRCFHNDNITDDPLGGGFGDDFMGDVGDGEITEEYAERYRKCSHCEFEETERIDDCVTMYEVDDTFAPTCTENGYLIYSCKYCDYNYNEYYPSTDHSYSQTVTDPTCTEDGYTTYSCNKCDYEYLSDYVDALGHEWEYIGIDSYCNRCGSYCSHELNWDTGLCRYCDKSPCPDCMSFDHESCGPVGESCPYCGSYEHYAYTYEECPLMNGGMWCDDCCMYTDHMTGDPICPSMGGGMPGGMWCDDCGMYTDHMTGEPICPSMGGDMPGDMWCDHCGMHTDHTTEMCPVAPPPFEEL